jgi:hypothetical protein
VRISLIILCSISLLFADKLITEEQIKSFNNKISKNNFLKMSKIIFKSVYKKKYKNNFEIFAGASATNKEQEISINLKYSLYDEKEKKEFNKRLLEKLNILNGKAKEYFLTKDLIFYLKTQRDFYILKDKRMALRVDNAIINLDDRLNLTEKIILLNQKISDNEIKLEFLKVFLINNINENIEDLL